MPPKQLVLKHDPHILLETLHEDDHVLAIAKPFGVLAHPSPGFWARGTLAHALVGRVSKEMMEERGNHNEWDSFIPRCIVHRLDAGTTGVMVLAKSPEAEINLAQQLRAQDMLDTSPSGKKVYVALLLGHLGEQKSSCVVASGSIGRHPKNNKMWTVTPAGKPAKTVFRVHAFSQKHGLSLVTAELFSGRTHQIRVHAACLGAPVANDKLYASFHQPKAFRAFCKGPLHKGLADKRQLLHAWALNIDHPLQSARLQLRAPIPSDMANIIRQVWPHLSNTTPVGWPNWPAELPGFQEPKIAAESRSRISDMEKWWTEWWDSSAEGQAWLRDRDASEKRQRKGVLTDGT